MLSFRPISGAPISGTPRKLALIADVCAFALTGGGAGVYVGRRVSCGTGAFAFTGNPADLIAASNHLLAGAAEFTFDGKSATLRIDGRVAAPVPGFAGAPSIRLRRVAPKKLRALTLDAGGCSFELAGQDAHLTIDRSATVKREVDARAYAAFRAKVIRIERDDLEVMMEL